MTEAEWLTAPDPKPMLEFLRGTVTDRKLRLFACACCRRIEGLLTNKARNAVLSGEQYADGLIDPTERHAAWVSVGYPKAEPRQHAAAAARCACASPGYPGGTHGIATHTSGWVVNVAGGDNPRGSDARKASEKEAQANLLRCIFGNPFRPVTLDPAWLTSDVLALAKGIYAERAFDRMPILADALQDAGCDNPTILEHCRGSGPHARGCWVVDLILGKS